MKKRRTGDHPHSFLEKAALLIERDRALEEALGLFPELPTGIALIGSILEVFCGPGMWSCAVAQIFPHATVTGIDENADMVQLAEIEAGSRDDLPNLPSFRVMNAASQLAFAEDSFDLVASRFLTTRLHPDLWQDFLRESHRLLREGGILRLLDTDWSISSHALSEISTLFFEAISTGKVDSRGIAPLLQQEMKSMGYQQIQQYTYHLDLSPGAVAHTALSRHLSIALLPMSLFLQERNMLSANEQRHLYEEASVQAQEGTWQGVMNVSIVRGQKVEMSAHT